VKQLPSVGQMNFGGAPRQTLVLEKYFTPGKPLTSASNVQMVASPASLRQK